MTDIRDHDFIECIPFHPSFTHSEWVNLHSGSKECCEIKHPTLSHKDANFVYYDNCCLINHPTLNHKNYLDRLTKLFESDPERLNERFYELEEEEDRLIFESRELTESEKEKFKYRLEQLRNFCPNIYQTEEYNSITFNTQNDKYNSSYYKLKAANFNFRNELYAKEEGITKGIPTKNNEKRKKEYEKRKKEYEKRKKEVEKRIKEEEKREKEVEIKSFTEETKSKVNILDLISDVVDLKSSGTSYKGLCPFHQEETPSFVFYPDNGTWTCFGSCASSGDIFEFLMKKDRISFREAYIRLAEIANIPINSTPTKTEESITLLSRIDTELESLEQAISTNSYPPYTLYTLPKHLQKKEDEAIEFFQTHQFEKKFELLYYFRLEFPILMKQKKHGCKREDLFELLPLLTYLEEYLISCFDEATEIYKYINDEFQKRDPIKQLKNEKISEQVARGEKPDSYLNWLMFYGRDI